jgi:ATP-binding cassette subfamily B protein
MTVNFDFFDIKKMRKFFLNYRFILKILWQCAAKNLVCLAFLILIYSIIPIGVLFLNKEALNIITSSIKSEAVFFNLLIVLGLIAIANIVLQFIDGLKNIFSALSLNIVSKQVLYAIQRKSASLDLKFYDTKEYYIKLENTRRVLGRRWDVLIGAPLEMLGKIIALVMLVGVLASFNIWLIPIIFFGITPKIIIQLKTRKRETEFYTEQIPETRKISYTESLLMDRQYAKEVRLFGFSEVIINMAQDLFIIQFKKIKKIKIWSLKLTTLWGAISSLTLFGVSVFITYYTIKGQILLGDWQLYTSAALAIQANLNALFNILAVSYEEDLYADILMEFLNTQPEIEMDKGISYPIKNSPPLIEFCDVSFSYPGNTKWVLKNLNFTIKQGEKIALIGLNGSGKSTIIKLLTRLYDPNSGKILFDGVDIKSYKPSELYSIFGVVFQDFSKYAFTLNDNISICNFSKKYDKKAVKMAATESGVDKIALKLPDGFDTYITKSFDLSGFSDLSGGDWQKIAIARGFFRQSPIVILDEPTSALDPEAECNVYNKFIKLCINSTAIIISHRLSSVSMVDRIFVIKDGQIAEAGTHQELMNLGGEYTRLFNLQADLYNVSNI